MKNNIKHKYDDIITDQLSYLDYEKIDEKYKLETTLYYKNPSCDLDNVSSLMSKFTNDTLQKVGVVNNDNVKHCVEIHHRVGGQDKENPRCEIEIIAINE
jgi:Holliday junction resolvase RusA-like endonuclease